jgi:N-acetylmuramoyl-L-alanine amidase
VRRRVLNAVLIAVVGAVWATAADAAELAGLKGKVEAPGAREAIARVAYAEAAGQGDDGLAGVVFTVLNRLNSGAWGSSIEAVLNAPRQFEPVWRAGGDWRGLAPVSPTQRARIEVILNLALEGRLPDPTGGALYFQNPAIVAERARAGSVSPDLVDFGGRRPSAVIGDHSFYPASGAETFKPAGKALGLSGHPGVRGVFVLESGEIAEDARQAP